MRFAIESGQHIGGDLRPAGLPRRGQQLHLRFLKPLEGILQIALLLFQAGTQRAKLGGQQGPMGIIEASIKK